jgi:hypothetical protein
MNGFRHAALVVTAAYAITYGVLVFIEFRWIEAYSSLGITRSSRHKPHGFLPASMPQ